MLPSVQLVKLCYSGQYTEAEMLRKLNGHSGLTAHLGTNDCIEVERRIANGDKKAKLVFDAMIYQTARYLGSLAPVNCGKVDAILLTGAIANSKYVTDELRRRLEYLAPVFVYPGEDELTALAHNAYRAMTGQQEIKEYK
jgi:butyrate kinase